VGEQPKEDIMTVEAAAQDTNKQDLDVTVYTPRDTTDRRPFEWSKHLEVAAAAAEAAATFGYEPGNPTLAKDGHALDRTKQLVAVGVRDGDVLELVDAGGGV
jgi:hypothetical protein